MISVGDATRPLGRHVLSKPGGFGWWYGDLLDADQNGLVLIASFGLPFLPGIASAARAGHPQRPSDRPSLNLALYERGRLSTYLLEEVAPDDAVWLSDEDGCVIGRSRVVSVLEGGRRRLQAELDCALPGSAERITGTVSIEGPMVQTAPPEGAADPRHAWTPLAVGGATGRAELYRGSAPLLSLSGRAYHDRNLSEVPLDDLGIRHWLWGRVPDAGCDHIYYLLWPDDGGEPMAWWLTIDATTGALRTRTAEVRLGGWRPTRYLASWWRHITLHADGETLAVQVERIIDNGPFYHRYVVRGPAGPGIGERVLPSRIDHPLVRPFVRMSVWPSQHRSFLAPWFLGPRHDRLQRLLAAWSGRPALEAR